MKTPPPYRIETDRLVIRCWEPRDAPLLKDAIDSSIDHLAPWLPWIAHEPQTVTEKVDLLRMFRGRFDTDVDYIYGIFDRDERHVVGGTGLHTRTTDGASFEIGYWIRASATRQGFATETVAALTRVALELCDCTRVELRVEPANDASLGVPRKLGYIEEATLRERIAPVDAERPRDVTLFSFFADNLPGSPCVTYDYAAFDARGERL